MRNENLGPQLVIADFGKCGFRPECTKFDLGNHLDSKPMQALWSSSLKDGTSAWEEWCSYEEPEWVEDVEHWVFVPKDDAHVFTVNSLDDAQKLPTHPYGYHRQIDFGLLKSSGYDGLHLTENGASELHWDTGDLGFDFNAWDCESTVWLNTRWIHAVARLEDF